MDTLAMKIQSSFPQRVGLLKEGVVLVQGIMVSIFYKFQNRGSKQASKLPKASIRIVPVQAWVPVSGPSRHRTFTITGS